MQFIYLDYSCFISYKGEWDHSVEERYLCGKMVKIKSSCYFLMDIFNEKVNNAVFIRSVVISGLNKLSFSKIPRNWQNQYKNTIFVQVFRCCFLRCCFQTFYTLPHTYFKGPLIPPKIIGISYTHVIGMSCQIWNLTPFPHFEMTCLQARIFTCTHTRPSWLHREIACLTKLNENWTAILDTKDQIYYK